MDQEPIQIQPEEPKETGNASVTIFWFLFAFVPSIVSLPFVGKNAPRFPIEGLTTVALICCLVSGFGVMRGIKDRGMRIFLGICVAGIFFVLNAFVVILVGCSNMGPI